MKELLDRFRRTREITIVSGLPRSGTSMMMKMLSQGGMTPLTDDIRTADEDNPRGYYEYERVKKLDKGDRVWLAAADGKLIKIVSALLLHLPETYRYRIVFMRRAISEVLASQRQMVIRRGEDPHRVDEKELVRLYARHLSHVESWIDRNDNVSVIYASYNQILRDPAPYIRRINAFLGGKLDEAKMAHVVEPGLYRQRSGNAGDEAHAVSSGTPVRDRAPVR